MDYGPIKSLTVFGNLNPNGILEVKIPFEELRNGQWQLCIADFSYEALEKLNHICCITSNFITDVKYNLTSTALETYFPSLTIVSLKGVATTKSVTHLEKNWFWINNMSDTLKLFFEEVTSNKNQNQKRLKVQCFVTVLIMLQRKK